MHKIIFAFDLDGTTIFPKNKINSNSKKSKCVEHIKRTESSFMDNDSFNSYIDFYSKHSDKVLFLPITSRSVSQYKRIEWPNGLAPKLAITTNGANLLKDGVVSSEWHNLLLSNIGKTKKEREHLVKQMSNMPGFVKSCDCDSAFDLIFFETEECVKNAKEKIKIKNRDIKLFVSENKIYVLSSKILKEIALLKIKEMEKSDIIIAAGNDSIDVGFLNVSDFQIITSNNLAGLFNKNTSIFSENIFESAKNICDSLI